MIVTNYKGAIMKATIKLNNSPFRGKLVISGTSNQHITINGNTKKIFLYACCQQRQRIFLFVSKFLAETIDAKIIEPVDMEFFKSVIQVWVDDVCKISFKSDTNIQPTIEKKAIREGRKCVLTALGLKPSQDINLDEDLSHTPPEELVEVVEPVAAVEPQEPTTKTYTLPISSHKALTLTLPIDLTRDEAELIANSSLEYLKALLLSQYKE